MTAITAYGVGNLFSLQCSLEAIGEETIVTADPAEMMAADRIILPGVGAFADAAEKLRSSGLDRTLKAAAAAGKPLMGICLGMQMLFEKSYEYGEYPGLGLLRGEVRPIAELLPAGAEEKIPQMGWNSLRIRRESPLLRYIREGDYVYFVHSYAAVGCGDSLLATTDYGAEISACVGKGSVFGCQFHPEKSGRVGLALLRAFCEIKEGGQ